MKPSSFQSKRQPKAFDIKGTKPQLLNKLLLTSSGVPTLDTILGSGVAVGSVILLEEDTGKVYSDYLLKCFLSEGVVSNHELFVSSLDLRAQEIIDDLPGLSNLGNRPSASPLKIDSDELKIAWRYKNMELQNDVSSQFGHNFDMSKKMEADLKTNCKITAFDRTSLDKISDVAASTPFQMLLERIKDSINDGEFSTEIQKKHDNILRIGIHSFGSPQWNFTSDVSKFSSLMCRFLVSLRNLMRTSFSVAFLTLPTGLFRDSSFINRIENLSDAVFRLESFAGSPLEKIEMWKDYDGLFHIRKLPRLNSMTVCTESDVSNLAFKIKRRRFVIEKIHLPPLYTSENNDGLSKSAIENSKTILKDSSSCSFSSMDF